MSPAPQPIPDRFRHCTPARSLYLFTTMSTNTGIGVKMLQLTMITSISAGVTALLANTSSMAEKMTSSVSSRAASRLLSGGK